MVCGQNKTTVDLTCCWGPDLVPEDGHVGEGRGQDVVVGLKVRPRVGPVHQHKEHEEHVPSIRGAGGR